jgi:hypothetical protein
MSDATVRTIRLIKAQALRDAADELKKEQFELGNFSGGIAYSVSLLNTWAKEYEDERG